MFFLFIQVGRLSVSNIISTHTYIYIYCKNIEKLKLADKNGINIRDPSNKLLNTKESNDIIIYWIEDVILN